MSGDKRPSSEKREELAGEDGRPDDYNVLIRPNGAANGGYAYHEPNDEGDPLCNAGNQQVKYQEVTMSEAKYKNKSPCQMCNRILNSE